MLGDVQDVLVKKLLDCYYNSDGSIGASPAKINTDVVKTYGVEVTVTQDAYKIGLSVVGGKMVHYMTRLWRLVLVIGICCYYCRTRIPS